MALSDGVLQICCYRTWPHGLISRNASLQLSAAWRVYSLRYRPILSPVQSLYWTNRPMKGRHQTSVCNENWYRGDCRYCALRCCINQLFITCKNCSIYAHQIYQVFQSTRDARKLKIFQHSLGSDNCNLFR